MLIPIILLIIIFILISALLIGNYNEQYWKKRGVKLYGKNKASGVFWDFFTQDAALFEIFGDLYKDYKTEPAVGIGSLLTPALFVIDPRNVHQVLVEDFNSFNHRGIEGTEGDQLADSIIFMHGPRWKLVRENISPLFTLTKLKSMYYIMDKSAQDLVAYLKNNPKTWTGDCYETLLTFSNAAVCGTIFGIDSDSIFNSPFLKVAKDITASNWKNNIKLAMAAINPSLTKLLGIKFFKEHEDFLVGAVEKVIQTREKNNIKRHDFADMCISIQKNGTMKDPVTGYEVEPTYGLLAAQAMFFLIAGVEPVSTTIFCTLIELSRHPDILERVHQEIDKNFNKHDKLTYEVICDMEYVNQVLCEVMRKCPPIGFITRQCIKDTVLPIGNIKVDKGTKIFTPIYQMHNDPDIYPDPDVFDPDRFANDCKLSDEFYMPFGIGNRMCIGAKYSMLQIAAGVVHILRHFSVKAKKLGPERFKHHLTSVRPINVDIIFVPRNIE